jgi:hypothetical protein
MPKGHYEKMREQEETIRFLEKENTFVPLRRAPVKRESGMPIPPLMAPALIWAGYRPSAEALKEASGHPIVKWYISAGGGHVAR